MFGQCAAGANWEKKLSELTAEAFWKNYWRKPPAVNPIKAFCTPFRISFEDWYKHATNGGILFDRCRIANLTCKQPPLDNILKWCDRTAKELAKASVQTKYRNVRPERTARTRKRT